MNAPAQRRIAMTGKSRWTFEHHRKLLAIAGRGLTNHFDCETH